MQPTRLIDTALSARELFISDLHLEVARPDITSTLLQFLQDHAGTCDALFILGDLFEVWIGDDDASKLADQVAAALHQFGAAGAAVYLMHGNRDFLLGEAYASRCAATLIHEPYLLASSAGPILLLHGDSLCTDDVEYQQFRTLVRNPAWQQEFLAQSLQERRDFANKARQQSQNETAHKAMAIMDVNPQAVELLLQEHGQVTLLHGHTHRPAIHEVTLTTPIQGQMTARRIVLGSWEKQGWFAVSDAAGISLHDLPLLKA